MKIAVLSDLHANIHALRSVMDDLDKEKVERILVAGDLIGYYYWPREVVELIMSDGRFECVRGNHENILKQVLSDEEAARAYRRKYGSGYEFCRRQLSNEQLEWLLSLPDYIQLNLAGVSFHVGHGSLGGTDEYLYPDAPIDALLKNYSDHACTVFGHTHYPFIHEHAGRYLINPGSVGQPRDVGGLASYIVINSDNQVVRFKRKAFNVEPVVRASIENDPELSYLAAIMTR